MVYLGGCNVLNISKLWINSKCINTWTDKIADVVGIDRV